MTLCGSLQPVAQRRRHELVIDAPTDVVGARRAAVAPPGVVLAFRVERAVGIDPAAHAAGRAVAAAVLADPAVELRSEEHTSELQSLMRISYAVFCLKKTTHNTTQH